MSGVFYYILTLPRNNLTHFTFREKHFVKISVTNDPRVKISRNMISLVKVLGRCQKEIYNKYALKCTHLLKRNF